jgi:hypothetical protein
LRYSQSSAVFAILQRLKPLIRKKAFREKDRAWVEPSLLAEIEYRAKSAEGNCGIRSSGASGRICNDRKRRPMVGVGHQWPSRIFGRSQLKQPTAVRSNQNADSLTFASSWTALWISIGRNAPRRNFPIKPILLGS